LALDAFGGPEDGEALVKVYDVAPEPEESVAVVLAVCVGRSAEVQVMVAEPPELGAVHVVVAPVVGEQEPAEHVQLITSFVSTVAAVNP
jgi:hypothetical protein